MNSQKKSKKNFKVITSAFTVSIFTLSQVLSLSSLAFAEAELSLAPASAQSPAVNPEKIAASTKIQTKTQTGTETSLDTLAHVSPISPVKHLSKPIKTFSAAGAVRTSNGVISTSPKPINENQPAFSAQIPVNVSYLARPAADLTGPADRQVAAEYQLAIGQGTSVKLYKDGSYDFIDGANVYHSDKDGRITFGTSPFETKWALTFADKKLVKIEIGGLLSYEFETVENRVRLIKSYGKNQEAVWNYDQKSYVSKHSTGQTPPRAGVAIYSFSEADFENDFVLGPGHAFISFKNSYGSSPSALKPVIRLFFDDQGGIDRLELNEGQAFYNLLRIGTWDVSEQSLGNLKDRSLKGLQNILENDKLVKGNQQVVLDGKKFRVVVQSGTGKILLDSFESGGYTESVTDAQGNVTFSVPQTDGTKKIYDVKIDDQGIVSLVERNVSQVLINGEMRVVHKGAKQYVVTLQGQTFESNSDGLIRLGGTDEPWAKFDFDAKGYVRNIVLYLDGGMERRVVFEQTQDGKIRVAQIETYYKKSILQDRTIFNYEDASILEETFCDKQNCSSPLSSFTILKDKTELLDGVLYENGRFFDEPRSFDEIYVNVSTWTEFSGSSPSFHRAFTHYAGGKIYQLYQGGNGADVTTFDLVQIKDRTTENLRKALKDDRLLEQGQIIVASDGTKFKLVESNSTWLDIRRLTDNGGISLGDDVSLIWNDGKPVQISVKQSDGTSKVYDIKIDDRGIVNLLRTGKDVAAEYQVMIGQNISVKLLYDGSYSFIDGTNVYQSDKDGWITVGTGAELDKVKWKLNFADKKLVKIESQIGIAYEFETIGNRARLLKSVNASIIQTFDYKNNTRRYYWVTGAGQLITDEISFYNLNVDLEKNFDFMSTYEGIFFRGNGKIDPAHPKPLISLSHDNQGAITTVGVREGDKSYGLLRIGTLDVTKGSISSLKDRSLKSFQGLLINDKLVHAEQDVKVDGITFKIQFVFEGRTIYFYNPDQGNVLSSETDAQGNVTLTVPQIDGAPKVYDVKINDQGIVSLMLQTPVPAGVEVNQLYTGSDLEELLRKYAPQIKKEDLLFEQDLIGAGYYLIYSADGKLGIGYETSLTRRPKPISQVVYFRPGQPAIRYNGTELISGLRFSEQNELVLLVHYGGCFGILDSINDKGKIQKWIPDDNVYPLLQPIGFPPPELEIQIQKWTDGIEGANLSLTFPGRGTYAVEYTTDFTHWTTLKEYVIDFDSSAVTSLLDSVASNAPPRFYRFVKKS